MASEKHESLAKARGFLESGEIGRAIEEYQKILAANPCDLHVQHKLGELFCRDGDFTKAIEIFMKVAKAYSEKSRFPKAAALLKQVVDLDASQAEAHARLAEAYRVMGHEKDAVTHLQTAATLFEQAGNADEHLDAIKRLVQLEPENVERRLCLAKMYSRAAKRSEAIGEFLEAALHLKSAMRIDEFVEVAEHVLTLGESNTELLNELARVYLRRGQAKLALQKLKLSIRARPRDVATMKLVAQVFIESSRLAEAAQVYQEIGKTLIADGRMTEMREALQRVKWLSNCTTSERATPLPTAAGLRDGLAEVDFLIAHGLTKHALGSLEALTRSFPKHPEIARRREKLMASADARFPIGTQPEVGPDAILRLH